MTKPTEAQRRFLLWAANVQYVTAHQQPRTDTLNACIRAGWIMRCGTEAYRPAVKITNAGREVLK